MPATRPPVPFPADHVEEVFLPEAPLVAVVAQVRFPAIASIARQEFLGPFQEEIRGDYPLLHPLQEVNFVVGPEGLTVGNEAGTVWRFRDRTDSWSVSLAPSFIALESRAYVDRPDFVRRFHAVLRALGKTIAPTAIERFGLRYVDRIVLDDASGTSAIAELIRPEVGGVSTTEPGPAARLVHTFTDTQYDLDGASLHARWGLIPERFQLDPFHGEPVAHPSWLLDLDMFTTGLEDFDVDGLSRRANDYADHIYSFFRWVVEDELLRRCGGAL